MKVCILGGDNRQLEIIRELKNNSEITLVGYENLEVSNDIHKTTIYDLNIKDYDVIIFPVSGVSDDYGVNTLFGEKFNLKNNFLNNTKKDVLLFTGIMTDSLKSMLEESKREAIVLMNDPDVIKENTIPTVEGIIADVVYNTDITINDSNVLVIGCGNIGQRLVPFLDMLGAKLTVGVKDNNELIKVLNIVKKAILTSSKEDMIEVLKNIDIIINTAPTLVLDKEYLDNTNKQAYILDVASCPYGIDCKYATKLGIKNKILPGIPSKVAPKTAGLILTKKIKSKMKGVE